MALLATHTDKLRSRHDLARITLRTRDQLAYVDDAAVAAGGPLLLDTGVYIHQLKGRTPVLLDHLIGVRQVNHSIVAVQEMLHAIGVLDPIDPRTEANVAVIRDVLDGIPTHRLYQPSRQAMADAAVYAGILCRLRSYVKDRRMKALHDCTLFLQAREMGCTLVSANVVDFDLLQQLGPEVRLLFYEAS
ncbi:DNA-binding protein [Methylobacterium sp. 092160098-2]|uniref:type II toxin-antitoxin system VapC family toxin n=1 Tax=Methylobacterium sp. 092160098-2 TaxID=3025129 RepID=UPI0023819AB8|nr:DNA-binding protein [Methylobacterium sp. 092160098-2]MDE4915084.1 DNA-binding protein [Methylobacterium sp. 092160098-2]